jgi:hypothetical protein
VVGSRLFYQLHQALYQVSSAGNRPEDSSVLSDEPDSIAKWLPQLYMNHVLRSTQGFSITTVFLDLIGSFASLAELVIASYLASDLPAIWGNPLKLGLSGITLCTDGWFVGQKLVFGERRLKPNSRIEGERQGLLMNTS